VFQRLVRLGSDEREQKRYLEEGRDSSNVGVFKGHWQGNETKRHGSFPENSKEIDYKLEKADCNAKGN